MKTKICLKCKIKKLLDSFYKDKTRKDGYRDWCKGCINKSNNTWYQKNKQKRKVQIKLWAMNNKEKRKQILKRCYIKKKKETPWKLNYKSAKQRCNNPNIINYKNYGGRRIKFSMTMEDFKFLWFRDKAYNMKKPTIDRKDNDGNYELSNCQFIELADNIKKQYIDRKKK